MEATTSKKLLGLEAIASRLEKASLLTNHQEPATLKVKLHSVISIRAFTKKDLR